ncbi:MAG: YceI family protein, partial [Pseudomonadota bacterium]
ALAAVVATAAAQADVRELPPGEYGLDDTHAYITFSYSHLGFSNPHVGFNRFDAALNLNPDDLTQSGLEVTIDAASIDSRVAEFDEHLNGGDYFDTAAFPEIRFESTRVSGDAETGLKVTGDLTIKDTTRPVTLDVTLNKAGNNPISKAPTLGFSARGSLKRSEFGLGAYAPAVSDEVDIIIEAEFVQPPS